MNDEKYYEDLIKNIVVERINRCSFEYLNKLSQTYKKLEKENGDLAKQYPLIYAITDDTTINDETVTVESVLGLQMFYVNKMKMEDEERLEIYKMGYYDCIKFLMSLHLLNH